MTPSQQDSLLWIQSDVVGFYHIINHSPIHQKQFYCLKVHLPQLQMLYGTCLKVRLSCHFFMLLKKETAKW